MGIGSVLLFLLLEERKARIALESRVFKYLEDEQQEARAEREATRPKRPEGLNV